MGQHSKLVKKWNGLTINNVIHCGFVLCRSKILFSLAWNPRFGLLKQNKVSVPIHLSLSLSRFWYWSKTLSSFVSPENLNAHEVLALKTKPFRSLASYPSLCFCLPFTFIRWMRERKRERERENKRLVEMLVQS